MYNNNTRNTTSDSDDLISEGYSDEDVITEGEHSSGKMYSMIALWPPATDPFTVMPALNTLANVATAMEGH